jgi:hypothetical protein
LHGAARTNYHRVATAAAPGGDSDQYQLGHFLDDRGLGSIDLLLSRTLAGKAAELSPQLNLRAGLFPVQLAFERRKALQELRNQRQRRGRPERLI